MLVRELEQAANARVLFMLKKVTVTRLPTDQSIRCAGGIIEFVSA